jgi:hypothetical protein
MRQVAAAENHRSQSRTVYRQRAARQPNTPTGLTNNALSDRASVAIPAWRPIDF